MLVVSPHLDDAVISCGMLLAARAQTCVLTLLAGVPDAKIGLCEWDQRCGFANSAHAVQVRRTEDRAALSILGVEAIHRDFLDSQYATLPSADVLAAAVVSAMATWQADIVCVPLGLHHCDHERVHDGMLLAMRACPEVTWVAYQDLPYAARPGVLQARLATLRAAGAQPERVEANGFSGSKGYESEAHAGSACAALAAAAGKKERALAAYGSQLAAIGIPSNAFNGPDSERYWLLRGAH